jgi:glucose/arabinose dehydrogenase/peptidoglycan/xylan/chitin deacetylase (PgdA/CDA1 family)
MNNPIMKKHMKKFTIFLIIASMLASFLPPLPARAAIIEPGFEIETVADGLTIPTAMAFADDGRIFVAEKGGVVRLIKNGVLLPTPVITLSDINTFGDRGLIGIATDPDFQTNGYLYLSYSYENTPGSDFGGAKTGRIVRVTVVGDVAAESSKVVILGTIGGGPGTPSCENFPVGSDCIPSDSNSHSVGGLRFGPDGKLYATFGDGSDFTAVDPRAERAQDVQWLSGKLVRINTDGTAPADNPFYDGDPNANRSKIYALGVRNAFRFNFHPTDGRLFLGDVGWSTYEEINHVTPGANFGWPCWEGNFTTSYGCTESSPVTLPTYVYGHNTTGAGSVTAGAFGANGAYPASYNNTLIVGDYAQNWIKLIELDTSSAVVDVRDLASDTVWPVDLSTGPDGNVYYLDVAMGTLNRITHTTGNRRPVPTVSASPTSGLSPLSVNFSSDGSFDPDGDALTYLWNFDDETTSNTPNPAHVYHANGAYDATLTLTDIHGSAASKSINITVGNQAPTASIDSPASGALYQPNQLVTLSGSAIDPETGALPASAFHWDIILHHNTHVHFVQQFDEVTNPTFIADNHENDPSVYMEIVLTVTDPAGLTATESINMYIDNGVGSGNLITNPSVETESGVPGVPQAWFQGWFGTMNPVFTYPVAGFDGTKAMQLEITSHTDGTAKWYFSPVFVTPGEQYHFKNFYTANVTTYLVAQFGLPNGTYQYQPLATLPAAATPTEVNQTITIPEGVQTISLFHELKTVGILTTDNFSLSLSSTPTDNIAPTVSVDSPADGVTIFGNITVAAHATDNPPVGGQASGVAGVTLLVDGAAIGAEDTVAPYDFSLDTTTLSNGAHTIAARARDAAGNVATSILVNVTVSNSGSSNLILNPSLETAGTNGDPDKWLRGGWGTNDHVFTYPVAGVEGADAAKVEITSYTDGDAKWYFEDVPLSAGQTYAFSHKYKSNVGTQVLARYTMSDGAFQYQLLGNVPAALHWTATDFDIVPPANTSSITIFHVLHSVGTLEVDEFNLFASPADDTLPPEVSIASHTDGEVVSGIENVTASAIDDVAIARVFFLIDQETVAEDVTAPYEYAWDTTSLGNGTHIIAAMAQDTAGKNAISAMVVVQVNNTTSNLILNPSLETLGTEGDFDPANWFRGGWGTNTRIFSYPTNGTDGADAAKVEITSYTDGDAKWYFENVAITAGTTYDFSHQYKSTISTEILARYTLTDGGFHYQFLGTLPASANWTATSYQITPPANVVSMTVFHVIAGVGELTVDDFSLEAPDTTPGTDNLILNGNLETANGTNPLGWEPNSWGNHSAIFTYPIVGHDGAKGARLEITSYPFPDGTGDAKWKFDKLPVSQGVEYTYRDHYRSNTISDIIGQYTLTDGSFHYFGLAKEIQPTATWETIERTFVPPSNATHVTFFHLISAVGFLEIDDALMFESGSGAPSETVPPVVEFTNPLDRETVSGIVTLTTLSSDNVGITYIFYAVDGIPISGQITEAPYAHDWDSTSVPDGLHTLKATTHDPSGNNSTHTISVNVNNTNPPPPPAGGLIQNPSLETADASGNPDHWIKGGWGTNDHVFTYPVAGVEGADAAKVEITSYTDGDAKWYFEDVPVVGGNVYTFEHAYRSDVITNLTTRYTMHDGSTLYLGLANLPAVANWTTDSKTFTVPTNAVSMTIMHILHSTGLLEVDDYSLIAGNTNQFAEGLVTLSFDDGWLSHYTEALPVLDAANLDGTFYIVSQETANAVPVELVQNPSLANVGSNGDPEHWHRGGWGTNTAIHTYPAEGDGDATGVKLEVTEYTDGDAKWFFEDVPVLADEDYAIAHRYQATAPTEVYARYTLEGGSFQYEFVGDLEATGGTWQDFTRTITTPANAVSLTVFHVLVSEGVLTTDNYSVKRVQVYVDPAQVLALQASGHEIGAHTRTHPNLTTLSSSEQESEIAGSRTDLLGMGVTSVTTIAYPLGTYDASVKTITENAGYVAGRSVDRGYNATIGDKYALRIQQVDRTTTIADIQNWVNQADQNNAWLILMFHQIDDDLSAELGITEALLNEIVTYVAASPVSVVTVAEGVALMNP